MPKNFSRLKHKTGFTLIEILVVFAILGVLSTVVLGNFQTSLMKARDVERKASLYQIRNALEAYKGDHGAYPDASSVDNGGQIKACGCTVPASNCEWGGTDSASEFCDGNKTVYMEKVPSDPLGSSTQANFCYKSDSKTFQLYVKLENTNDSDKISNRSCGGITDYNYGLSSPNTTP